MDPHIKAEVIFSAIAPIKISVTIVEASFKLDGVFSSFNRSAVFSPRRKVQYIPMRQLFYRQPIHTGPQLKANLSRYIKEIRFYH